MSDRLAQARATMRSHAIVDRDAAITRLLALADLSEPEREAISAAAAQLVRDVRASSKPRLMETLLAEYSLSTDEGIALMCLAEALLRVPDAPTMDDLIADKIVGQDWASHADHSGPLLLNASAWALMLTGRVLSDDQLQIGRTLQSMVRRVGEPAIRGAVSAAMRRMGSQFVLGQTITEALKNGAAEGYLYSFDMLGEAARTDADALRYHHAYANAIVALGKVARQDDVLENHGISVKLSALHPRYEVSQAPTMLPVLCQRLLELCLAAKSARIALNIDAEEADRLDLSLTVIETVLADPQLAGWHGFGVVVQAYGGRAPDVIDWLDALTQKLDRRISVRLVKGAYWDTEIKRAQTLGLPGFPVYTAKAETDLSYMACARQLLAIGPRIFPQFATHNAHTMAAVLAMAPDRANFEFQRLHGMGEALHEIVHEAEHTRCRIYAPVGAHEDLLAYLVRRLLENGANSSFVNQIVDNAIAPEAIVQDPIARLARLARPSRRTALALPKDIFGARPNSQGYDLTDPLVLAEINARRDPFAAPHQWQLGSADINVLNPADPGDIVGKVSFQSARDVTTAMDRALAAQPAWAARSAYDRAGVLNAIANLYEANAPEFYALSAREAGKTLADAVGEVREAVDFLRYYAAEAIAEPQRPARGVIACISPWNFPLAIFTGQIAAALVAGNAVIAKPAEQTNLIALRAVALMHEAGVPADVLQLVLGLGETVGAALVADPRINGVCFTGSTVVARLIEAQLAKTAAPDTMLIAETGGLNAMLVDSTALPEQAVRDIIASAFQSAGQRCSALRLLYVQADIAGHVMDMLHGALDTLTIGNPWDLSTDVGPVIDAEARDSISAYCADQQARGAVIASRKVPAGANFVAPQIVRVNGIADLEREIFGPVLHVATYKAHEIDAVVDAINARGYGLTFALHTRIDARVQQVVDRLHVGNFYVNRNQIGAVVGSQPFGGEGLSGTGPKAGGPLYLRRFGKAQPLLTSPGVAEATTIDPQKLAVPDATTWAARPDRIATLRAKLRGKAERAMAATAALDFGPIDLPGPTGEANSLRLVGRGTVLCLGPGRDALLAQTVQALATGNGVIAVAPGASEALRGLLGQGLPLTIADGIMPTAALRDLPIDAVAYEGDAATATAIRQALATRSEQLVPMIAGLDPAAYVHERALTVDTTAAGGNASLLASMDGAA